MNTTLAFPVRLRYEEFVVIVTAIAAMDRTGLIGHGMKMPWHLPADLRRFRDSTMGKPLVMGRRTFQSLRAPLPGRLNVVLTHNPSFFADGCRIAHSIEDALRIAEDHLGQTGGDEAMIIGGAILFEATVPLWDRLLLTVVEGQFHGDTYFPLGRVEQCRWQLLEREFRGADAKNVHSNWFLKFDRQPATRPSSDDFDLHGWLSDPHL
jgi:dihydrofolate reductase